MEPVLGGRDDQHPARAPGGHRRAAMEPVLGGRDDAAVPVPSPPAFSMPQWSPSLADGTTHLIRDDLALVFPAAMEPVLGGRDDRNQCSPVCENRDCRNGARPWRTGRPVRRRAALLGWAPPQWSPSLADGTTKAAAQPPALPPSPQWSPSLADGTTRLSARRSPTLAWPQWSPSLADGTTAQVGGRQELAALPQWSPSLADGTTGWRDSRPA